MSAKDSQATRLVKLVERDFRIGCTADGESFVRRDDSPITLPLRGSRGVRSLLAKTYAREHGAAPSQQALADALLVIEGIAREQAVRELNLRVAGVGQERYLDLGDPSGRVVKLTPDGWSVATDCPHLFRRSPLISAFPSPARPGSLEPLQELLGVRDEAWQLVRAYLVSLLLGDIPHPILAIRGLQGSGKTTRARFIAQTIDPSPAPIRTAPRDLEQFAVQASGSWVVVFDNVSTLSEPLSDALCRAVTGDGVVKRQLYTDSDVMVLAYRRCVILTSIDAGDLRGDLADRLLLLELDEIPSSQRRLEAQLQEKFTNEWSVILGGLLDLTCAVLGAMRRVARFDYPRMADFARVVAAVDLVTGGNALELYLGQRERLAEEVVEGDLVAQAIRHLVSNGGGPSWSGTAKELLWKITPTPAPKDREWPKTARGLSGQLRRTAPALRQLGVEVDFARSATVDRARIVTIRRLDGTESPTVQDRPISGPTVQENELEMDGLDGLDGVAPFSSVGNGRSWTVGDSPFASLQDQRGTREVSESTVQTVQEGSELPSDDYLAAILIEGPPTDIEEDLA